ncbi:MAG TPA: hypothetical protein VH208_05425, partial [Myxococcaceae bacterium]|nr:hypothetical protein [Myxococcaceae bacterium]
GGKKEKGVSLSDKSSFSENGFRSSKSWDAPREFTRYESLSLGRSSEVIPPRAVATTPPPAHFADTISIGTFDVADVGKVLPGPGNAAFERALSRAFTSYAPSEDSALKKARAEGGDTSFTFPSTGFAGPHVDQAKAVAERLKGMEGLSADTQRILTQGASFAVGPAGEPLIRGLQAVKIGEALRRMPAEPRQAIEGLLSAAKNDFERALILKCVSPRASRLFSPEEAEGAFAELRTFANAIRGAPVKFLEERSTVVFTGGFSGSLKSYSQQRGNSCVAASIRRAMATEDPFLNWILRAEKGNSTWGSEGRTANEFEESILYGDKSGELDRSHGLNPDDAAKQFLSPKTHLDYQKVKYYYRLWGDPHHSERLAQAVLAGQPVLLRRGDSEDRESNYSHCQLLLWARGEPGKREFLVADGYADWQSQSSFESGGFSHYYGHSHPTIGVGRSPSGRPEK